MKFILIVVNQIIIERQLIEENSPKVDEILIYICESLKKENYSEITDDYFQIECLKRIIYQLNNVTDPVAKIINEDCKKFFSKKNLLKDFSKKRRFFDEIKIIITYSLARFFFIITSNGSKENLKDNYSKILSQCSRCFEGMNLEDFSGKNQGFFTTLISLF